MTAPAISADFVSGKTDRVDDSFKRLEAKGINVQMIRNRTAQGASALAVFACIFINVFEPFFSFELIYEASCDELHV